MSTFYTRVDFYELCRLCAQSIQDNKIKIFDQKGQEIQLQSKINKCLSMRINKFDFLPKVVCPRCLDQLEICYAFWEECQKSEKMLSSYLKNYQDTEDFKKSGKVYIKDTARKDITSKYPKRKMDLMNKRTKINADMKKPTIIQSVNQQPSPSQIRNQSKKLKSKDTSTSTIIATSPHIQSDVKAIDPINIPTKGNAEKVNKEPFIVDQNIVKIDLTSENIKEEPLNKFNSESTAEIESSVVENTSVIFPISQYQIPPRKKLLSLEEIRQRNREYERRRRIRVRADPEKYESVKLKEKQRREKRKAEKKLSLEEIRQKNREYDRRRRDRVRADPEKYEAAKLKEKQRREKRKAEKKIPKIADPAPRQQRIWRIAPKRNSNIDHKRNEPKPKIFKIKLEPILKSLD